MEEKYLTYGIITDGKSKMCRYVHNICKSTIYKHHKTKWSLFPALTIDSLFNISSKVLPTSGAFIGGSNMPFPGYFPEMFILVENSTVPTCNYAVWQDCKILHFSSNIMENLSENLLCVCLYFFPMLSPELFLLLYLREKQNGIQKGECNLRL